jgi:sec-independent protein translocase protein TatA
MLFDPIVWVIILAIIVLLFGGSRIPGLGKSIGQSIRGFRTGLSGEDEEKPKELESKPPDDTPPPPSPTPPSSTPPTA